MREWVKIAESLAELALSENGMVEVDAGGRVVCIAQTTTGLYAFAPKCPHAGAPFVRGYVDAKDNVVCPHHRYKFCIRNGKNVTGEGYHLKHWPVEVREDGIYVGLEKSGGLWGLLK